MNDRFKFRFWRKNIEGKSVQECADLMSIDGSSEPYDNGEGGAVCYFPDCCVCEQCTGLKDKNGKLIYENDIVKFKNDISEVKWCINGFAIDDGVQYLVDDMDIEVIGNIHENPELLEGKTE